MLYIYFSNFWIHIDNKINLLDHNNDIEQDNIDLLEENNKLKTKIIKWIFKHFIIVFV